MKADLHCHSQFSDGSMTVEEILFLADKIGLNYLAITDHDTFKGAEKAKKEALKYNINIIYGAEISCFDYERKRPIHLLCYNPKTTDNINKICVQTLKKRNEASVKMAEAISKYYPLNMAHIMRYAMQSQVIYKQHIVKALMDMGYDNLLYGKLYNEILSSKNGKFYIPFDYPNVLDVIEALKQDEAKIIVAHPNEFNTFEFIEERAKQSLIDGVELNHPSADENTILKIKNIAEKYNLILTGGTDFHGLNSAVQYTLGSYLTDEVNLCKLISNW